MDVWNEKTILKKWGQILQKALLMMSMMGPLLILLNVMYVGKFSAISCFKYDNFLLCVCMPVCMCDHKKEKKKRKWMNCTLEYLHNGSLKIAPCSVFAEHGWERNLPMGP